MYRVKLAPIATPREAHLAAEAGADALGFLLGTLEPLPGRLTPEAARRIILDLPKGVQAVMVTYAREPAVLESLLHRTGAHAIELRSELPPEALRMARRKLSGVPLACALAPGPEAPARARELAPYADAFYLALPAGPPPEAALLREVGEAGGGRALLVGVSGDVSEPPAGAYGVDISLEPTEKWDLPDLRRRVERAREALGLPPARGTPPAPSPGSPRA